MPSLWGVRYSRTVSLPLPLPTFTEEVLAEDVDWSTLDPSVRSVHQTREDRRNITLAKLAEVHASKVSLEEQELELIRLAKSDEATWKEVGDAICASRQAAWRAYASLVE
jgi:hypothetical protein